MRLNDNKSVRLDDAHVIKRQDPMITRDLTASSTLLLPA